MEIRIGAGTNSGELVIRPAVYKKIIRKILEANPQVFIFDPKNDLLAAVIRGREIPEIKIEEEEEGNTAAGHVRPGKIKVTIRAALYYNSSIGANAGNIKREICNEIEKMTGTVVTKADILVTKLIRIC